MRKMAELISYLSLVVTILSPIFFYVGAITLDLNKIIMNIAMVVWFVSALCWMGREKEPA